MKIKIKFKSSKVQKIKGSKVKKFKGSKVKKFKGSKVQMELREIYPTRVIMLIDMDAFFAQIEQVHNPMLKGKPIFVAGSPYKRSVITAASYEAKKFGVKSGMSLPEGKKLCPDAIVVLGNQDKYLDYCHRLIAIYQEFTDLVEPYSIDEAFLDVTGVQRLWGPAETIAQKIKARIKEELNLTCSIGIGPNKLLAKMAADRHKPDGLTIIEDKDVPNVIWPLPVEELIGVGERMKVHLNELGIKTIGDLAHFPLSVLKERFGKYGEMLYQSANGIGDCVVNPSNFWEIKSVGHSYTLPYDTNDSETIRWYIYYLASKVSRRLQKEGLAGKTITLVLRTNDFTNWGKSETIGEFTAHPKIIADTAYQLFIKYYQKSLLEKNSIRLVGVSVSNLTKPATQQLNLFWSQPKVTRMLDAVGEIKNKYGEEIIDLAIVLRKPAKTFIRKKVGCFLNAEYRRIEQLSAPESPR
ncbi:MAG: DNA polymerase IV [candidate division WOR-3 bacterium]|nr:DNA polymerase IV [candidate division WOR-3 bacterium]